MLNHITIMGRLTRDPELRRTASGIAVANFTLAVERDFASKEGGERETDFIDCVAWRQSGEFVSKHFTKGRMAVVSGRLEIRSWNDKDGNKRRSAEVVAENIYFGDSKRDDSTQGPVPQAPESNQNPAAAGGNAGNGSPAGGYPAYSAPAGYTPPSYDRGNASAPGYNYSAYSSDEPGPF